MMVAQYLGSNRFVWWVKCPFPIPLDRPRVLVFILTFDGVHNATIHCEQIYVQVQKKRKAEKPAAGFSWKASSLVLQCCVFV